MGQIRRPVWCRDQTENFMARRNTAAQADPARCFKYLHRARSPAFFRSVSTAPTTVPARTRKWCKARAAVFMAPLRAEEVLAAEILFKSAGRLLFFCRLPKQQAV